MWETTDGRPSGASARAYPDYAQAVQDVAALRAIPATERVDKQQRLVEDKATAYWFDETGTGADDGDLIIKPTDVLNGGRWFKIVEGGTPTPHAASHVSGSDKFPDHVQTLYVGKHGNDSNAGKTPSDAFLTFGAAITAAGTPGSEAAAITVVCLDDGEYDEDLTCVDYVNVYAPNVTLKGEQALAVMHLTVRRMINDGDNNVVSKVTAGRSFVTVENIYSTAANAIAVWSWAGDLKLHAGRIETTVAIAIFAEGTLLDLEVQEIIANTTCLCTSSSGGVVIARVGSMSGGTGIDMDGTDEVDAVVGRLVCTAAYNINATSTLRLLVGELSGTETAADGADVRVTRAGGGEVYVDRGDPDTADFSITNFTADNAWHDLDLEGIVPAGGASKLVHLGINYGAAGSRLIQMRKKGNVNDLNAFELSPASTLNLRASGFVMLSSARVIEYKISATMAVFDVTVRGWFIPAT